MAEEIGIIYEDTDLMVLDKPSGWVTTRENLSTAGVSNLEYVEDWVGDKRPNQLPRKGIVHRLDKGTSGVLLVAKNESALIRLKSSFKNREVRKSYLALVGGDLPAVGDVEAPIGRLHGRFGKFGVVVGGKVARTAFRVLEKYRINGRDCSLLEVWPLTGRTHQIRVHLKYLGWPICGDKLYGGPRLAGLDRIFLHAFELSLPDGNLFRSVLPEGLTSFIKAYEESV